MPITTPPHLPDEPPQGAAASSRGTAVPPSRALRAARWLLAGHCGLILFSTVALTTFLAGPPGAWLQEEPNRTVFRVAWRFSGPTYVVLGALAALLHLTGRLRGRRALLLFLAATSIALGAELLGTSTSLPFGEYRYTSLLGYRILGLVPFPIPISWFYMLVGSVTITSRLRGARDSSAGRWRWAGVAAVILLAWDVSMDPAMVHTSHWIWGDGDLFVRLGLPSSAVAFFSRGVYYGMPLSNWLGWYLTGLAIARVMLAIVPPSQWTRQLGDSRLPIALYAINGIMPVALCARDGLWWAAILGAIAMLVPVVLAITADRQMGS